MPIPGPRARRATRMSIAPCGGVFPPAPAIVYAHEPTRPATGRGAPPRAGKGRGCRGSCSSFRLFARSQEMAAFSHQDLLRPTSAIRPGVCARRRSGSGSCPLAPPAPPRSRDSRARPRPASSARSATPQEALASPGRPLLSAPGSLAPPEGPPHDPGSSASRRTPVAGPPAETRGRDGCPREAARVVRERPRWWSATRFFATA